MSQDSTIFSLRGKRALVTGATGYLGRSMAFALAGAGARVLVNSRSEERGRALVDALQSQGHEAEAAIFDVTDAEAVADHFARCAGLPLHILINNAYVGGAGSMQTADAQAYLDSYDVTVVAAHRLVKAALPNLRDAVREAGDASVINIASMYGVASPDVRLYDSLQHANPPFYGAAKAALLQWTRYVACELGAEGIRVNAISPGPFPSEAIQRTSPEFVQKLAAKVPMARIGQASEIAGPVLFLASVAASFVNGANIAVDGGWTSW